MDQPLVEIGDFEVHKPQDLQSAPVQPNLTSNQMAIVAREMAMNVREPEIILRSAGITKGQFEAFVQPNPFYKRAFEAFTIEWESALSTNKRIAIQAAAGLEDALPQLALRMTDETEPLNQTVETAKLFAKLAGAGEPAGTATVGERFNITINLGSEKIEANVGPAAIEAQAEAEPRLSPGRVLIPDLTTRAKTE